ncbi:hypothetical protein F5884DRAFT_202600 [Xylogone sp. PMI_703]|nr:hypothetical protein F5884DRAFT_202600 [Xylogone sp. PMI_703]
MEATPEKQTRHPLCLMQHYPIVHSPSWARGKNLKEDFDLGLTALQIQYGAASRCGTHPFTQAHQSPSCLWCFLPPVDPHGSVIYQEPCHSVPCPYVLMPSCPGVWEGRMSYSMYVIIVKGRSRNQVLQHTSSTPPPLSSFDDTVQHHCQHPSMDVGTPSRSRPPLFSPCQRHAGQDAAALPKCATGPSNWLFNSHSLHDTCGNSWPLSLESDAWLDVSGPALSFGS